MPAQPPREHAIGIAGCGRIAQALGRLLADRGEPIAAIAGRNPERALAAAQFIGPASAVSIGELPNHAAHIIVAVPDAAIEHVACTLADSGMRDGIVLHTSGASGIEPLQPLIAQGVSCGTLHPLQTVAKPAQGVSALPGSAFALSGQPAARQWALELVTLLDGQVLPIPDGARPLYHAAAVMAGNYVITLLDAAASLLAEAGVKRSDALRALAPLARTSLANAVNEGPVETLTGPIERGDAATVAAHLSAMAAKPGLESIEHLYRAAGLHTLDLAARGGLTSQPAAQIAAMLAEGESIHA